MDLDALSAEDRRFARAALDQGLCTESQIEQCASQISRLKDAGVTPLPKLGEMLARKGYLGGTDATIRAESRPGSAPSAENLPPEVSKAAGDPANAFGKFIRVSLLGAGGMGEVWRAWDRELARWVALKFLKGSDPQELARFQREARTSARLNHPNIASVYEVGEVAGKPFIAMQLIAGKTFGALEGLTIRALVELLRDAALAVHAAHRLGVVHRDLKPANLMVEDGPPPRVYVMDFGLAKQTALDSSLSMSGAVLGTPAYMAPEQASGRSHEATAESDVYSLGATLYELMAGRPPFRAKDVYRLLRTIVEDEPVSPRSRNPVVPRDIETIILKCLEKDPARRYSTARELSDDLDRWLKGEPILAHPPSAMYRARKYVARRKTVFGVAMAGVAAVALALAILIPGWLGERERVEAERQRRREQEKEALVREAALKELAALWSKVVLAKQMIYMPARTPKEIRSALQGAAMEVSGYVDRHPKQPQAYYVHARVRVYLGEFDAAEKDLKEAIRLEPEFGPAWRLLGRVHLEQYMPKVYGDSEPEKIIRRRRAEPLLRNARVAFETADRLGGDRQDIARWGLPRTREDDVNEKHSEGLKARFMAGGSEARGKRTLLAAQAELPSEEFCREIGNWSESREEAIAWLDKAIEMAPHFGLAYLDRALNHSGAGSKERALEDADRAVELLPLRAQTFTVRGSLRRYRGDLKGALADFNRALELDPEYDPAYMNRGEVWLAHGDAVKAIADCTRALELFPDYALAYIQRAGVHLEKRDPLAAMEDLQAAHRLDPDLPRVHSSFARAYGQLNDLEKASASAERAIALNSEWAEAYLVRGEVRVLQKRLEEARTDFAEAARINPRLALSHMRLAQVDLIQRKVDRALERVTEALRISPQWVQALIVRSMIHAMRRDPEKAKADIEAARSIAPAYVAQSNEVKQVQRALEKIRTRR